MHGLQTIANTHTIRVPTVICEGRDTDSYYIVMEYLPFTRERKEELLPSLNPSPSITQWESS